MHSCRPIANRQFYPGELLPQIEEFLESRLAPETCPAELVAAAVPHAGWRFSGGVAARTLKTLAERSRPESIFLLGAFHRPLEEKSALYPEGEWQTPLGAVAVDSDLAANVLSRCSRIVEAAPDVHGPEHSLEVELPFIHEFFKGVPIVPILVVPEASPVRLGEELAAAAAGRDTVAVASTDLTHYGAAYQFLPAGEGPSAHKWMRENDRRILDLAVQLDADGIPREARDSWNACGPGALAATIAFARARGAKAGHILEHTDSHTVTGSGAFRMAVGYAGIVFG